MLRPECNDSKMLIDWVEEGQFPISSAHPQGLRLIRSQCKVPTLCHHRVLAAGVKDAIEQMYLKTLFFGIAVNPEGTRLLEVACLSKIH